MVPGRDRISGRHWPASRNARECSMVGANKTVHSAGIWPCKGPLAGSSWRNPMPALSFQKDSKASPPSRCRHSSSLRACGEHHRRCPLKTHASSASLPTGRTAGQQQVPESKEAAPICERGEISRHQSITKAPRGGRPHPQSGGKSGLWPYSHSFVRSPRRGKRTFLRPGHPCLSSRLSERKVQPQGRQGARACPRAGLTEASAR